MISYFYYNNKRAESSLKGFYKNLYDLSAIVIDLFNNNENLNITIWWLVIWFPKRVKAPLGKWRLANRGVKSFGLLFTANYVWVALKGYPNSSTPMCPFCVFLIKISLFW